MAGLVSRQGMLILVLAVIAIKAIALFAALPLVQSYLPFDYNATKFGWDGYDQIAWNLAQGHGYRLYPDASVTMLRTPGFPLVLAAIFFVAGKSLVAVQLANLIFSGLTAVLVYQLALSARLSRLTALVASLVFLVYPGILVAESRSGPESLLTLGLVASAVTANAAIERGGWRRYAIAGIVNGAALLVTPTAALVVPSLFLFKLWRASTKLQRRRIAGGLLICGLATAGVMTPWIVRNYVVSRSFVPTMTVSGLAAFEGNHVISNLDSSLPLYKMLADAVDEQMAIASSMGLRMHSGQEYGAYDFAHESDRQFFPQFFRVEDEVAYYRELRRRAGDNYKRHPKLVLRAMAHNSWAFWAEGKTQRATLLNALLVTPLLLLSILGVFLGIRRGAYVVQFCVIVAALMLPYLVIIAEARYYIPIVPYLAILAAIPMASIIEAMTSGRNGRAT
jgi:4-amino-4-deoxy-L-arabinose transferase-like glycosyltransferase